MALAPTYESLSVHGKAQQAFKDLVAEQHIQAQKQHSQLTHLFELFMKAEQGRGSDRGQQGSGQDGDEQSTHSGSDEQSTDSGSVHSNGSSVQSSGSEQSSEQGKGSEQSIEQDSIPQPRWAKQWQQAREAMQEEFARSQYQEPKLHTSTPPCAISPASVLSAVFCAVRCTHLPPPPTLPCRPASGKRGACGKPKVWLYFALFGV